MSDLGTVTHHPDGFRVKFERIFDFDIETVWSALTDPKKLAIWFTDIEMDFTEGGQIMIQFRDSDKTKSYGEIKRIKKPSLFEYSWEDELATWELFPIGNQTRLVFTYSKLPDNYASSVAAGWHILLDRLTKSLLGDSERHAFGMPDAESERMKVIYTNHLKQAFPFLTNKS